MRSVVLIVAASLVLGVGLAFAVHELAGGKSSSGSERECTDVVPTLALSDAGRKLSIGLQAPRTTDGLPCRIRAGATRRIVLDATSADGRPLFHDEQKTGAPPAGSRVTQTLKYTAPPVAALKFCSVKQPVAVKVSAFGVTTVGSVTLTRSGRTCAVR